MDTVHLSSSAMLQPPAFAIAAERAIGSAAQATSTPLSSVKLGVQTSLASNVDALKAQQKALDHLDSVLTAAKQVFGQVSPLLAGSDDPAQAAAINGLLRGATYQQAPLFDAGVTSSTVGPLLNAGQTNLSIFSPEVRDSLQLSFDSAFDIYA